MSLNSLVHTSKTDQEEIGCNFLSIVFQHLYHIAPADVMGEVEKNGIWPKVFF